MSLLQTSLQLRYQNKSLMALIAHLNEIKNLKHMRSNNLVTQWTNCKQRTIRINPMPLLWM